MIRRLPIPKHWTLPLGAAAVALALFAAPVAAAQECKIKCEKCVCNLTTGICECTNCTLEGCTPQ